MYRIKELMTAPVFSLRETDTLQNARLLMDKRRIRHVPITTADNIFRGLITNRDVLANTISHLAGIDPARQHRHRPVVRNQAEVPPQLRR